MITLENVEKTAELLKNIAKQTPLKYSRTFSEMVHCNVYLKMENHQRTGSFKVRGAYNKIYHLSDAEKTKGVICSSAGNHAQGVAYASKKMGIKSTVYMPTSAPPLKVIATKDYGATVKLVGNQYDDAYAAAKEEAKETGAIFIHPFNDEDIICGQGTVGLEIYNDLKEVDYVFVPIGGGGLICGIAMVLKHLNPNVKVIGVEAEGSQSMKLSIRNNKVTSATDVATIADGIAVKTPGELTFALVKEYVDDIVTVKDEETAFALYLLLHRLKTLAEPAGAVALAAILNNKVAQIKTKNVVAIVSGGNINLGLLTQIVEKGMYFEGFLARISILIPDKAGILKEIISILATLKVNIKDISHDRSTTNVPVGHVDVTITFQTLGKEHIGNIIEELEKNNFKCSLLG